MQGLKGVIVVATLSWPPLLRLGACGRKHVGTHKPMKLGAADTVTIIEQAVRKSNCGPITLRKPIYKAGGNPRQINGLAGGRVARAQKQKRPRRSSAVFHRIGNSNPFC